MLADRGETGSKFGRATFSVLLLQDLAVVVLLMLIPLLAPSPDGAAGGSRLGRAGGGAQGRCRDGAWRHMLLVAHGAHTGSPTCNDPATHSAWLA